jgi:hypothetical protein
VSWPRASASRDASGAGSAADPDRCPRRHRQATGQYGTVGGITYAINGQNEEPITEEPITEEPITTVLFPEDV